MSGRDNPYVGPRAFATGEPLFGRERERAALLDLVIAERIVLLHSPSGAGKSSLLHAALIPDLRAEGFVVRPVIRVGIEPPTSAPVGVNRYVLSARLSLEDAQGEPARPLAELAGEDLLAALAREPADSEVLIFDQFEEVLTADPNDRAAKQAFFAALGELLRSPRRWAVFAMREDHVASLAPYVRALPTRLRTTFRLDLLGVEGATLAVQQPARAHGVLFTDAAARRLVDDLRQVRVQGENGETRVELGETIEPVQLQVACRNLWARLPDDDMRIEPEDVAAVGDVGQALADYYEAQVAAVAAAGAAPERVIRRWFERALISEQGLRSQVLQGPEESQGLANAVIRRLIDTHLVRAEKRRGMTWFELAHDRLLEPIRAANARWGAAHLSPVQRQAELWDSRGRPEELLLADLAEAERLLAAPELGANERAFLVASRSLRAREAETARLRRQSLLLRRVLNTGVLLTLVALVAVFVVRARAEADASRSATWLRRQAEASAEIARLVAADAKARQLAAELLLLPESRLDVAALLAVVASELTNGRGAQSGLHALLSRAQQLAFVLPGEPAARQLAASRDGTRLAGIDERGGLQIWSATERRRVASRRLIFGHVDVAFDASRDQFVTTDGTLQVSWWDAGTGALVRTLPLVGFEGSETMVSMTIAVAPAGDRFATADTEHTVRVWDASSGARLATATLTGVPMGPGARPLAFAPDGRSLAIVRDGGVALWAWAEGPYVAPAGDPERRSPFLVEVAFEPDGGAVVGLGSDGKLWRWPVAAGRLATATEVGLLAPQDPLLTSRPPAEFLALALAGDGRSAAAVGCVDACTREVLLTWDAASGQVAGVGVTLPDRERRGDSQGPGYRLPMVVAPGLAVVAGATLFARAWETASWRPLPGPGRGVDAMAMSPDGARVALAGCSGGDIYTCQGGVVRIYEVETRALVRELAVGAAAPLGLAFASATQLVTIGADGVASSWDMSSGTEVKWAALPRPRRVALHAGADGRLIAALHGELDGVLRVVDGRDGAPRFELVGGPAVPESLAIDPGGRWVAAGGCLERRSFASAEEEMQARLRLEDLTACVRGGVRVWDLSTGEPRGAMLDGSQREVIDLTWSHDGGRLLAIAGDGSARLWDLVGGRGRVVGDDGGAIRAAAFTADDRVLATLACGPGGCDVAESELVLRWADVHAQISAPRRAHTPVAAGPSPGLFRGVTFVRGGDGLVSVSGDGAVVWDLGLAGMRQRACGIAGHDLSAEEWERHVGPRAAFHPVCGAGPQPGE